MRTGLLALACLLLASHAQAQGGVIPGSERSGVLADSALLPDIFHLRTHTCDSFAPNCGPDNVVFSPFTLFMEISVPSTQAYTRFFVVTDIEGAVVLSQTATSTLAFGSFFFALDASLTAGLYKLITIVIGADGRASISEWYRFRVR